MRCLIEAEPGENACGAGRGGVGGDVAQPAMDDRHTLRILSAFGLCQKLRALFISRQYNVADGDGGRGSLLRDLAEAAPAGDVDFTAIGRKLTGQQTKKRGLSRAIAPHEADAGAVWYGDTCLVKEGSAGDATDDIG